MSSKQRSESHNRKRALSAHESESDTMTAKQQSAKALASKALDTLFKSEEHIDANALAAVVAKDAKTVRAYMRKAALRDQSSEKNNRWRIDRASADDVVSHFVRDSKAS